MTEKMPGKGFYVVYDPKSDLVYPAHQPDRFAPIDKRKVGEKNAYGFYGYYQYFKPATTFSKQLREKKGVEPVIHRWDNDKQELAKDIWSYPRGFHGAK